MKTYKNIFHRFLVIPQLILLISLCILSASAAAGDVDTSFGAALTHVPAPAVSTIYQTIVQPDGKIIATGSFSVINNIYKKNIVRLNPDGSLDPTFNAPFLLPAGGMVSPFVIQSIALQSNGKIILAGQFLTPRQGLIRLNADGSMDTAFNNQPLVANVWFGYQIQVMPDDSIYYSGRKLIQSSGFIEYIVRADSEGIPQEETPIFVSKFIVQPDAKILIYNDNTKTLRRLNPTLTFNPSYDESFAPVQIVNTSSSTNTIYSMLFQPDGKILIGGQFNRVNGFTFNNQARLNSDGSIDGSFSVNAVGPNSFIYTMLLLSDGKIMVAGGFRLYNGVTKYKIALLNTDGTLVNSFAVPNNLATVYDLDFLNDGKFLASGVNFGIATQSNPNPGANDSKLNLIKFSPDGTVDDSYYPQIGENGRGYAVRVQPDNKFVVAGDFTTPNGVERKYLVRFNADGTVDTSFNQTVFEVPVTLLEILPDGKILAGNGNGIRIFNPNGSSIASLSGSSFAVAIKAQPDGKVLVGKTGAVIRNNGTTGSQDASVAITSGQFCAAFAFQPDGKILIGGSFADVAGTPRGRIARLNADLTLDTTFNPPGGANGTVQTIGVQSDGKILIGGDFTAVNFDASKKYLARLNSDGTLDTSFSPVLNTRVSAIRVESGGKIIMTGFPDTGDFNSAPGIIRKFNPDGTLDSTFNNSLNINLRIISFDLQSNNKIILVGLFTHINGVSSIGIARLFNTSNTMFDFDGDSKTDISIFRPSVGEWWYSRSSDGGNYAAQFGNSSDKLTPGDFTGDGRVDFAVFRPSTGEWFILRSEDGSYYSYPFGTIGDIPVVGDFDGDGKADSAVFRPTDTNWYIRRSSDGGTTIQQFGATGDAPAVADYDGDGKSDIAIWRASVGEWWIQQSSNLSVIAYQFGNSADKPVQGDYTGDGDADVAIWRPSTGEWFILRSENQSYYSFPFGANGDVPAPGDYDGDGKFDATVFRPSQSTWYVQRTTAGTLIQSFGIPGDVPVPNAFSQGAEANSKNVPSKKFEFEMNSEIIK
ncbi:MAG: FG-GAP-like repeat-containing protein [Pyrinomonadaceae bacterium]